MQYPNSARLLNRPRLKKHFSEELISTGSEGGVSGEFTHKSMLRVFDMIPEGTDVPIAVDLGSGRGNVVLAMYLFAHWRPRRTIGFEICHRVAELGKIYIRDKLREHSIPLQENGPFHQQTSDFVVNNVHSDILQLLQLPKKCTVVYSCNKCFHPDVLLHVYRLLALSSTVRFYLTVKPLPAEMLEPNGGEWNIVGKTKAYMCGSGQAFQVYNYARRLPDKLISMNL